MHRKLTVKSLAVICLKMSLISLDSASFLYDETVFTTTACLKAKKKSIHYIYLNPLPEDKILGLPKLRAFADDKLNITQNIRVVFHRMENIVGKEENAGYQHFLLFPQCFQKAFSSRVSKVVIVW